MNICYINRGNYSYTKLWLDEWWWYIDQVTFVNDLMLFSKVTIKDQITRCCMCMIMIVNIILNVMNKSFVI